MADLIKLTAEQAAAIESARKHHATDDFILAYHIETQGNGWHSVRKHMESMTIRELALALYVGYEVKS